MTILTNPDDLLFINRSIELSSDCLTDKDLTPFGAVVVLDGKIIGEGRSSVNRLRDATAHAEVMAIRQAGLALNNADLTGAVMYCSGFPCPMCLVACYWARIERIVTAATLEDSQKVGFEDQQFYDQLMVVDEQRLIKVEYIEEARSSAAVVLNAWKAFDRSNKAN